MSIKATLSAVARASAGRCGACLLLIVGLALSACTNAPPETADIRPESQEGTAGDGEAAQDGSDQPPSEGTAGDGEAAQDGSDQPPSGPCEIVPKRQVELALGQRMQARDVTDLPKPTFNIAGVETCRYTTPAARVSATIGMATTYPQEAFGKYKDAPRQGELESIADLGSEAVWSDMSRALVVLADDVVFAFHLTLLDSSADQVLERTRRVASKALDNPGASELEANEQPATGETADGDSRRPRGESVDAVDACSVVTKDEAASALGQAPDDLQSSRSPLPILVDMSMCGFQSATGPVETKGGVAVGSVAVGVWRSATGATSEGESQADQGGARSAKATFGEYADAYDDFLEPVDGLGDQAVWDEELSTLLARKGDRIVGVRLSTPGQPGEGHRQQARALAVAALGRL
jgi:hypothetical protein